MNCRNGIGLLFAALLALAGTRADLPAATYTWDGGGADDFFTTPANWAGNVAPNFNNTPAATGDNLIFDGSTRLTPNHDTQSGETNGQTAFTITFAGNAGPFIVVGNKITLGSTTGTGGSGGSITNQSAFTQTFNCDVAARSGIMQAQSGDLAFNGQFSVGNGATNRTNIFDGAFDTYVNGPLSSKGVLVKNGSGTLFINNHANDFSGALKLNAGTLALGTYGSLANSAIVVANGAVFDVSAAAEGFALQTNQVLSGTGVIKGRLAAGDGITVAFGPGGGLNLDGSVVVNTGGTIRGDGASGAAVVIHAVVTQLTLKGTTLIEWRKIGNTLTNDTVEGAANLTYGGTLVLTNVGSTALTAGDALKLFSASNYAGSFDIIRPVRPGPGLSWDTSRLAVDGTLRIVCVPRRSALALSSEGSVNLTVDATPGQVFSLLTSTNLALPLRQWTVLTNDVVSAGSFVVNNRIAPGEQARFYCLTSPPYSLLEDPLWVGAATKPTNQWQIYATRTLDHLPAGVSAGRDSGLSQYGGLLARRTNASGYFYPAKIDGRWWLVDPEGCLFLNRGVASVTTLSTTGAVAALAAKFGSTTNWANVTTALLRQYGFNGAGAWSSTLLGSVTPPLVQTRLFSFLDTYSATNTGPGYPYVFDPAFETFCDRFASNKVSTLKTDPWLLGYFSDNELPFPSSVLNTFLALPSGNASGDAAWAWLRARYGAGATTNHVTAQDALDFLGYTWGRYCQVVSQAIKRYDPNHLYLGSRLYYSDKDKPEIFRALGPYVDVVSVNHYGYWTPDLDKFAMWERESGRPILITEFYVKGEDSGMPNNTGAGWVVHTQADRGLFYQNFTLALLESKVCIGWHWFKYADNDPADPTADPSNIDSNKGVVSNRYDPWYTLLEAARLINERAYRLANYFDGRPL